MLSRPNYHTQAVWIVELMLGPVDNCVPRSVFEMTQRADCFLAIDGTLSAPRDLALLRVQFCSRFSRDVSWSNCSFFAAYAVYRDARRHPDLLEDCHLQRVCGLVRLLSFVPSYGAAHSMSFL
jgi:hypothetical protein